VGSGLVVPFGLSLVDNRVAFGELDTSDARGVDNRLRGDTGRFEGPEEEPGGSRSFDLPLPNPPNGRFEDDFLSGDDARP
jgi:hypothetical protein